MKKITIGLIGFGTVGTGVVKLLRGNAAVIRERLGAALSVKRIADIDIRRNRGIRLASSLLTTDAKAITDDPSIDLVVELIGGIEPARTLLLRAIANGKPVVTA